MKIINQASNKHTYQCPECGSIIEIEDSEFQALKVIPRFPHLMGLADFQNDTRIKIRVCDCPVCGADIMKENCKI